MSKILIVIFSVYSVFSLDGSTLLKGFEALKNYDYFKAKKCFYKDIKKNTCAAAFGLSTIYFRKDNPFHNYDSAYKYATLSKFKFEELNENNKINLQKLKITASTINNQCDSINYAAHNYYLLLSQKNKRPDNILNHYISTFLFSKYRDEGIRQRDLSVFTESKKEYKSQTFEKLIHTWPESNYLQSIFYEWEKSLFEENTEQKSIDSYTSFINNFPKNRFLKTAQDAVFNLLKINRDKEGLYTFLKTYPQNEHTTEAWKLFFILSVDKYTSENLAEFNLKNPEFPFQKTIIEEINLLDKQLIKIKILDNFGFIDTSGKLIIEPIFEEVEDFYEGLAVANNGEKYGYINKIGNWAVKALYDEAEPFKDGVAIVRFTNKAFLIDRTGTVISNEYDEISNFNDGLAIVRLDGKYGAINRLGNNVIANEYSKLGDFKNSHAWFEKEEKFGIIDNQNFMNIINDYEWIDDYTDFIRARKNGAYGVINKNGVTVIPFEYDRIECFIKKENNSTEKKKKTNSNYYFIVIKSGKYGIMDQSGCYYQNLEFDFDAKYQVDDLLHDSDNLLIKLYLGKNKALINKNGKKLCDFEEFDEIYFPSCGLIRYFKKKQYGYKDLKMHPAFKGNYDKAEDFKFKKAIVVKKEKYLIIDNNGNIIFNEPCDKIERFETNFFMITKNNLKGLLNENLKWIILPEFQEIEKVEKNYITLKQNGKKLIFNIEKNKIIFTE